MNLSHRQPPVPSRCSPAWFDIEDQAWYTVAPEGKLYKWAENSGWSYDKEVGRAVYTIISKLFKENSGFRHMIYQTEARPRSGWIGVDLDGTLARYDGWREGEIGEPIPAMVDRVKEWLKEGMEVRIVTARVGDGHGHGDAQKWEQASLIAAWTKKHIGVALRATASKDLDMIELWDDRAIQVRKNTGEAVQERKEL